MKMKKRALLLTLCAVLLVAASVMGTMAYLTSSAAVTNTFTVGSVAITLDEADVDNSTANAERDTANAYNLVPGHTYVKDPTVHVAAASEDCYVYVKVENGISAYEAATDSNYTNIAGQIAANGWTALTGVTGVYYKTCDKSTTVADLLVFDEFKIADNANAVTGWSSVTADNTKIVVTAYAVQRDGFATAELAWSATFGATP